MYNQIYIIICKYANDSYRRYFLFNVFRQIVSFIIKLISSNKKDYPKSSLFY